MAGHLSGSHQCHQNSSPERHKVQDESMTSQSMKPVSILERGDPTTRTVTAQGILESRTQIVRKLFPMLSLRPKTPILYPPSSLWETCSHGLEKQHLKQTPEPSNTCVLQRLWVREGKLFHCLQLMGEMWHQREPF